jgi:dihydropteroate synthase
MSFSTRPRYEWRLRSRSLALGEQTLILGILNVTPDSFSDGGHFYSPGTAPDHALEHALEMLEEGADVIDLGGESTRPGATPLSPDEEQARVMPVLEALLRERPEAIVSIDTFHAATARAAVEAGAEIVNDVSGHLWDKEMASTCARLDCGAVLMHTRGTPAEWKTLPALERDEIVPLVMTGLEAAVTAAEAAGVDREHMVIDPGLGFGKRLNENYPLLGGVSRLHHLKLPILIGASRKSFLSVSQTASSAVDNRLAATIAAHTAAVLEGAHLLRVHDVRAAVEAAVVADRLLLQGCP